MGQSHANPAQQLIDSKCALISAVRTGNAETVVDLLDRGVPIDTKDDEGNSLLYWAAKGGHVTTVRLLIRRGCDVDSVDGSGLTPLHWAAALGQTKAVQEIIRNSANKSVVARVFGTPLHQAALSGHVETVEAMLAEGCPIDVVNSDGRTALHFAAESGRVQVVRMLAESGCDVNAVKANGCTPLHSAAGCGRTEAVCELIKLGASKSVVAGIYGTPLHQAAIWGHLNTVEALLEGDVFRPDMPSNEVASSKVQTNCNLVSICDSVGETPVVYALRYGQVEVFKLLTSKGGAITDRDTHSLSTFEQCFSGGHASKLCQFCEACGIRSSGEGLRGALATLIMRGLVDANKVLCLCAISGDSVFLDDQFIELLATDACVLPRAMKFAKYLFSRGVPFLNQLNIPEENALNPLHMSLLSLKCFDMGLVDAGFAVDYGVKELSSFITKLLSHPVLKGTVNELFPNALSPLDLARQFELHDIAVLIEGAGGRPGVWANIPKEIEVKQPLAVARLKEDYVSMMAIAREGEHGREFLKGVFSSVLHQPLCDWPSILSAEQLSKENVLRQKPKQSNIARLILSYVSTRNWKLVGLLLLDDIADSEETLNAISQQFSDDKNRFLETQSYWLECGSSVTWKTLLDVLGHFETKHTIDELTDKIVSELGGAHQVSVQCCVLSEGAVWCAVWRRQVLLSCRVCLCLYCLLLLFSDGS